MRFGLDRPWYVQYGLYLQNVILHFDFGESFSRHQPVFEVLSEGFTNTLLLAGAAALVTWGLAIPLGVLGRGAAALVDRPDAVVPRVHLAVDPRDSRGLLLLMLAARTGWFPVGGMRSIDYDELDGIGQFFDVASPSGAAGAGRRPDPAGEPHAADARQPARRAAARLRHHRARQGARASERSSSSTRCATR